MSHVNGFLRFVREQGVVGLAVGFILGGAVSKVVTALVDDIIQPILGLMLGSAKGLTSITLGFGGTKLLVGDLISVIIDFLVVAAVVYWLFTWLKLDKVDAKKE